VATPDAVVPTVDTMSLRPEMTGSAQKAREDEDVIERADELRWPIALKDVRLEEAATVRWKTWRSTTAATQRLSPGNSPPWPPTRRRQNWIRCQRRRNCR
jgi:hypothetical protein